MTSRIFKTLNFIRWMRKTELSDAALCAAVQEMKAGLIDADLGGGLIKKRVPLPGRGKSGGVRTLIATRKSGRWIFVFGFEKSERDNVEPKELKALKAIAEVLLGCPIVQLEYQVKQGILQEICRG